MNRAIPVIALQFAKDPVGAIQHCYAASTATTGDDLYLGFLAQLEADFLLLESGKASLSQTSNGYKLQATRENGTGVVYNVDSGKGTIAAEVSEPKSRLVYTLNPGTGKVTDHEQIALVQSEQLEGLDKELKLTVVRSELPELFELLGVKAGVDTLEVASTCEHSDELQETWEQLRADFPSAPNPVMAQVFFLQPGAKYPTRSIDIVRVEKKGKSADLVGESGRIGIFARSYGDPYAGYTSMYLKDPQEQLMYNTRKAAAFSAALAQLHKLARDNKSHHGLAQLVHYLPQITVVETVVVPGVVKS